MIINTLLYRFLLNITIVWVTLLCIREIPGLIVRVETVMFYLFWYGFILRHCEYLLYCRMAWWLV